MSSLQKLREKLQAKMNRTCIIIVANGKAISTIKECCKSLKEHIKMTSTVEYFCIFDVPMYEQLNAMGVEEDNKLIIEGIPLNRIVTQCPPMFASRSTYWNMLNLIPKFREFDQGIMISSKIGLGIDITDDMISGNNSFCIVTETPITCSKDFTTGKYIPSCNENSNAYEYSEEDLPNYNNVIWGGNIVKMAMTIEEMIEKDITTDILLYNPTYYFNKYMWNNKPTKVFNEKEDFKNDISLCLDHYNAEITEINKKMVEYDNEHPEKEVKDKNPNNPAYETLPPVTYKRIPYDDSTPIRVLNTEQEYTVLLISKSQRQPIVFVKNLPDDEVKETKEEEEESE